MDCEKCGVQHDGDYGSGRFCSSRCARSFATKGARKSINEKVSLSLSKPEGYDCQCGLHFKSKMSFAAHSKTHKRVFENLGSDRSRKKWLIGERGHRCECCGLAGWMGKSIPLELDHIDGHPGHNQKENLRLLCPNCHAQTPHYRGANVGHHRETERQKVMARYPSYREQKIRAANSIV